MSDPRAISLFDFPLSIFCQMARVALAEKGLAHDRQLVNIMVGAQFSPAYLEVNPKGVVPSLQVGDEVWTDTFSILHKLDAAFVPGSLTAEDTEDMRAWMQIADTIPYAALLYATKCAPDGTCPPLMKRHAAMVAARQADPSKHEALGPRIESNVALRATLSTPEEMAKIRADIETHLTSLDQRLSTRDFIAGGTYSLADVMWTATLARLELHGLLGEGRPHLAAYFARLQDRPSWKVAGVVTDPAAFKGPPKAA